MAFTGGLLSGEDAAKQGLGWAAETMKNATDYAYPSYVSSASRSPTQMAYASYSPNAPMATISAPDYTLSANKTAWQNWTPLSSPTYGTVNTEVSASPYSWSDANLGMLSVSNPYSAYGGNPNIQEAQIDLAYNKFNGNTPTYEGLKGGDYDKLQTALQTPGEIAARRAYEQGQINLSNQMGGRGLYGSSIMANQARTTLEQPYMDTLATNAAQAAAQRYQQEAADLQNKNAFGLNVYGKQMYENQAANQMALEIAKANQGDIQARNNLAYQAWQQRVAENLSGAQMGLEAQKANQAANADLQGLLSAQNTARNQQALEYAKLGTSTNLQNVTNALAQQQALNSLRSGDTQQLQGLMAQQALAQNTYNKDIYGLDLSREQDINDYNKAMTQLMMTQAANQYQTGAADAARQQAYNEAAQQYALQQAEAMRQWQNQQDYEKFQYELAKTLYANQMNEAKINQALALAGQGAPLSTAAQNYALQQQQLAAQQAAADAAINAQNTSSYLGALGSAAGLGLLGYALFNK